MHRITDYALLFWANRGNHNENTSQKFLPDFTPQELQQAALAAQRNGAFKAAYADLPPITSAEALNKELEDLRPAFFDANFEPMTTAKSPEPGKDIIRPAPTLFMKASLSMI